MIGEAAGQSWSSWLLARFAGFGFGFEGIGVATDDVDAKAKILLLTPSILVPRLQHQGVTVRDTLAIAEYLHEVRPKAGLLPADRAARAHCRAVCGEMHSGLISLRSALPMNLKGRFSTPRSGAGRKSTSARVWGSGRRAWPLAAACFDW